MQPVNTAADFKNWQPKQKVQRCSESCSMAKACSLWYRHRLEANRGKSAVHAPAVSPMILASRHTVFLC